MRKDTISPFNTKGLMFFEVKEISVNEWHPLPDGKGKPEQVHIWIGIEDVPFPFVMRCKSRRPIDELIMALIAHADNVWPKDSRTG